MPKAIARLATASENRLRLDSSPFVLRCLGSLNVDLALPALDLPCGNGRHARLLSSLGLNVVVADIDAGCLAKAAHSIPPGTINAVMVDARSGLPFRRHAFGLAMIVHFTEPGIVPAVAALVAPGGYLIYETFGFSGENWKQLPQPKEIFDSVRDNFDILKYQERKSPNPGVMTVSVNLFAKRCTH